MVYRVLIPQSVDPSGIEYLEQRGYEIRRGSGLASEVARKAVLALDMRVMPMTRT